MLMTLLPLVGWATDYEVQVTTYNGSAVWTGAKPAVQPGWFTAQIVGGAAVTGDAKTAIAAKLQVKDLTTTNPNYDAGAWDYQLELANASENVATSGGDNYTIFINSSTTATLTITKFTDPAVIIDGALAFVDDDLVYTSQPQALLKAGATATANGTAVPVVYATSEEATTWVSWENLEETNANTTGYTVYYKVVGTDNYAGSAVKTMAAKPIAKATIAFNVEAKTGLVYDGTDQALLQLTDNTKSAVNFGTLQYKITGDEYTTVTDLAAITGKSAQNGTAYSVKLKVPASADGNWDEAETSIDATIAKATPVITAAPAVTANLTYTGEDQNLLSGPAIVKLGETTLDIQVKYLIKRKKDGLASSPYSSGIAKYAYDAVTGNHASTDYDIQQSTQATDDLNAAATVSTHKAIALADYPAEWYTLPEGKTLRVADEEQELVTAATFNTTTRSANIEYRVSTDGGTTYITDWAGAVPKSNTVGTYTVQCRFAPAPFEGAYDYNRIYKKVTTTIAAKAQVTVTTKANQSFGYGTTPVLEKTVAWEEQGTDVLNEAGLAWNWYTDEECNTDAVANASGYYEVGDYYVKAAGLAVTGTTAASQEIVYVPALVKITAGQVNATISGTATYGSLPTFTLTHTSGLSPAEAANFNAANNLSKVTVKKGTEVLAENVAPDNDALKALAVGEYDLEATAAIGGGQYVVFVTAGTLTVSANDAFDFSAVIEDIAAVEYKAAKWEPEVTVTGFTAGKDYTVSYGDDTHDNIKAGEGIVKIAGAGNYEGATGSKTFTINKANLTITADNFTGEKAWQYGKTEPTYTITATGWLESGDALAVGGTIAGIDGTLQVKRTSNETVGMHANALVPYFKDADGNEIAAPVATNYTLNLTPGNLQVAQGAITIKLKEAVVGTYGDNPAANITAAVINNIANYELDNCVLPGANLADVVNVAGVACEIEAIDNNKYLVGTDYEFTLTGATSTNYTVTISNGTYKVNPAAITLYAKDQAINWADEDNTNDEANTTVSVATVAIAAGALKCGDALTDVVASIVIASQNVGTNNISLTAAENANYKITVNSDGTNAKYGVLTVTGAPALALSTADADLADKLASYNGKNLPVTIDFTARNGRTLGGTRDWEANYWNTLVLPFDITVADLSKALGYAIVNVIDPTRTEVSGTGSKFYGKLTMKGLDDLDYIPANTPFMVKTADDIADVNHGEINFGYQTIVAPDNLSVEAGGGAKFTGTYATKNVTGADNAAIWFLMGNHTSWAFIKSTSTATWDILPFEAFINMSSSSASSFTFYFEELDGSVTAIKSVDAEDAESAESAAEGWYTINGIKLNAKPTQKGIYIFNGKKVAIQ